MKKIFFLLFFLLLMCLGLVSFATQIEPEKTTLSDQQNTISEGKGEVHSVADTKWNKLYQFEVVEVSAIEETLEAEEIICPYCEAEIKHTSIEEGKWHNAFVDMCPQKRFNCYHLIQEKVVTYYYTCDQCSCTCSRIYNIVRDRGCFSSKRDL